MDNSLESRQSTLIKAMRFPLIVLVVFAHSLGFSNVEITPSLDGWNIFHFFSEMLSHNLARLAVCWFYAISGYFFFYNLKEGEFGWKWISSKWKKRVRSLLIPYLFWNLLLVVVSILKTKAFALAGLGDDGGIEYIRSTGPLFWLWSGPINFPLYFMRDLMVMSLLSPLIYCIFRALKLKGSTVLLIVLFALYAFTSWMPEQPGISFRSLVFFSTGALLGIYKINMLAICRKFRWPAAIIAVVLLCAATYANALPCHKPLLYLFFPFGMMTFMNIIDRMIDNEKLCARLCGLASAVFFIYGAHEIFILGWTKGLFLRVFGDGLAGSWISYLFVPVVTLLVCLGLYWVFNKFMPRTLAFVSGGRAKR